MKKALKITACVVAAFVVLAVLAVLSSPLWTGPVVRSVANSAVPDMAGTRFSLESCDIGTFSGKILLRGLMLENPAGYSERTAVSFDTLKVDVDMSSLSTDVIRIREISLSGLFVSYLDGSDGINNFEKIGGNFSGGKDADGGKPDVRDDPSGEKEPEAEKPSRRVVIDVIRIEGAKVRLGMLPLPIPVPSITLRDIGKETDGMSLEETWKTVSDALLKACGAVGDGLGSLGKLSHKLGKGGMDVGTNVLDQAAGALKSIGEGGTESVKEGVDALIDIFKSKKRK